MGIRIVAIALPVVAFAVGALSYSRGSSGQMSPDAQVIQQLREAGSDLSVPHPIDFYLYLPSREAADRVASKLRATAYEIKKLDRAALGPDWLVLAGKTLIPSESELVKMRQELESLATAEGGEYDGWEAPIIR